MRERQLGYPEPERSFGDLIVLDAPVLVVDPVVLFDVEPTNR